jgi:hypothetical protein
MRATRCTDDVIQGIGQVLVLAVLLLIPMQFSEPYFVDTGFPHVLWAITALAMAGIEVCGTVAAPARRRALGGSLSRRSI